MGRRAGVLGHPIDHSLSPVIHRAAYEALGLDWEYDAHDVTEDQLAGFLLGLSDDWAGLSLTMPLKAAAVGLMDFVEPMAKLVGAVNTVLVQNVGERRNLIGANTDVAGIIAALAEAGVAAAQRPVVLGGGATATSAIAALGHLGATAPVVAVRSRARAAGLMRAAVKMGVTPRFVDLSVAHAEIRRADVAISTIPADAAAEFAQSLTEVAASAVLLDAIYDPLVTELGAAWVAQGGLLVGGERMLLHQAAEQVRLMTGQAAPLGAMDAALHAALTR